MQPPASYFGRLGGVVPRRASVTPRVRTTLRGAALPLEHHIRGLLGAGAAGIVNLYGDPGSGKTVALEHIAHLFFAEERLVFCDANITQLPNSPPAGMIAIYTSRSRACGLKLVAFEMAGWTDDDLIEYLAATHRQRVQTVMRRIAESPDCASLGGMAELWRIVLDVLAADDAHGNIWDALRWHLSMELSDPAERQKARLFAFATLDRPDQTERQQAELDRPYRPIGDEQIVEFNHFDARIRRLLTHQCNRRLLAAELLVADLCQNWNSSYLDRQLPHDLLAHTARFARGNPPAVQAFQLRVKSGAPLAQSNSASILHAMKIDWRPERGSVPYLISACLDGVKWPDIGLKDCVATQASFRGANLARARFDGASIESTDFSAACLRDAALCKIHGDRSNFLGCDLSGAVAISASLMLSDFRWAKLKGCDLSRAVLCGADLRDAQLTEADLSWADLQDAKLDGADFAGANFDGAVLKGLDLGVAGFGGACFRRALMDRCNLEYMELAEPDFRKAILTGALLTGSVFRKANFQGANLRKTGLADIDWEGCNLRDANLAGCSFHAGSTRSGLVGSVIAGEGSKTGFYTDDFGDRDFKPPEEIRKANLRGADLRNAKTNGVDFYLVDLRDAHFTRSQAKWFRKCGAILGC